MNVNYLLSSEFRLFGWNIWLNLPIVDRSDTTMLCVVYLWWILNLISFGVLAVEHWATEHSPFVWSLLCPSPMPSSSKFCCKLYSFEFELLANISENEGWHRMECGVQWESEWSANECYNLNVVLPEPKIFRCINVDGDAGNRFSLDDDPAMFKLFNDSALYGDGSTCSCGRTLFTAAYMRDCACVCMWPRLFS